MSIFRNSFELVLIQKVELQYWHVYCKPLTKQCGGNQLFSTWHRKNFWNFGCAEVDLISYRFSLLPTPSPNEVAGRQCFSCVCHSVHKGEGVPVHLPPSLYRALPPLWTGHWPQVPAVYRILALASLPLPVTSGGWNTYGLQAGGTHPTGMISCSVTTSDLTSGMATDVSRLKTMCQQYIISSMILDFFLINSTTRTCSQKARAGLLALSPDRLIIPSYHLCHSRDNLLLNISTYFRHV